MKNEENVLQYELKWCEDLIGKFYVVQHCFVSQWFIRVLTLNDDPDCHKSQPGKLISFE